MSRTNPTPTTSRRSLLASLPGLALGTTLAAPAIAAAAQPNPDAELIALCEEYIALDRAFCANSAAGVDMLATDPAWKALNAEGCAMVPLAVTMNFGPLVLMNSGPPSGL